MFEIYKKTLNQENIPSQPPKKEAKKQDMILQSENKVIECTILQPRVEVQTASKETQHHEAHPQPQPTQHVVKPVTTVVVNKGAIDAVKLSSSLFLIGSNVQ